jgi:hypothetical protein
MKSWILMPAALAADPADQPVLADVEWQPVVGSKITERGGGCRNSSSPTWCYHMNRKTGGPHCH